MNHKRSGIFLSRLDFFCLDLVSIEVAYILAYLIKFHGRNPFSMVIWRNFSIVILLLDALVMILGHFLTDIRRRGFVREMVSVVIQTVVVLASMSMFLYVQKAGAVYSRAIMLMTGAFHILLSYTLRCAWKAILTRIMSKRPVRYLLIGNNDLAEEFAEKLESDRILHAEIMVHLADEPSQKIHHYSGKPDQLEKYLQDNSVDVVVCASDKDDNEQLLEVAGLCEKYGVKVGVIPSFSRVMSSAATVEQYGKVKMLNFRETPLENRTNELLKRIVDIVASSVLIVLTSPIMLAIAIGVKVTSPGPILFKQERVGKNRKNFMMLKFRSMRITGTETTGWSTNEDNRKTKFGSFIRKFSLDELPQFFNVLSGQMSMIGPRPEMPYHVEHFMNEIPLYLVRQSVRPGITGWAQVNGYRGDTSIEKRVQYDIEYIENWSFSMDIKILFMTIFGGMINQEKIN